MEKSTRLFFGSFVLLAFVACAPRTGAHSTKSANAAKAPLEPDDEEEDFGETPKLSGTVAGRPFKGRSALAGKSEDGTIWVDVFDGNVSCEKRAASNATRVSISTLAFDWPEGKSGEAKEQFVTFDAAGSSIARPFVNAKTTFGKKPSKGVRGDLKLIAQAENAKLEGDVAVRWCD